MSPSRRSATQRGEEEKLTWTSNTKGRLMLYGRSFQRVLFSFAKKMVLRITVWFCKYAYGSPPLQGRRKKNVLTSKVLVY